MIWPPTAEIKYWRNLNLANCDCEAKFQYVKFLRADMAEVNLVEIKLGVSVGDRQTAKLNSPPNFPAIRYTVKLLFLAAT